MSRLPLTVTLLVAAVPGPAPAQEKPIEGKTKAEWLQILQEDKSPRAREGALAVLATFEGRDRLIIETVARALVNDKAERVRLKAVDAAGAILTSAATKETDKQSLIDAVGKSISSEPSETVRLKVAELIKDMRKEDTRKLVAILADVLKAEKSVQVRATVAAALGKVGEYAKTILNGMAEALKDPEPTVRAAVAEALGRIGDDAKGAVPALKPLLKDADAGVRLSAAFALGRVGPDGATAVPELSAALAGDTETAVRKEAARAFALMGLDAKAAVPALTKGLREDKSEEVRQQAALALGKMRGETRDAAPAMVEALKQDSDKTVRIFVAHALGDSLGDGLRAYVKDLADALDKEGEGDVRVAIIQELGALGPAAKDALPALKKRVADVQLPVRDEAKKAVKKVSGM